MLQNYTCFYVYEFVSINLPSAEKLRNKILCEFDVTFALCPTRMLEVTKERAESH